MENFKKEILMSFKNNKFKRQREYLFNYNYNSILNQYYFTYQREYVILSVEYFKDLVTLLKKAIRSSYLLNELITHVEPVKSNNNLLKLKIRPFDLYANNNTIFLFKMYKNVFYKYLIDYTFINIFNFSNIYARHYDNEQLSRPYNSFVNSYDNFNILPNNNNKLIVYQNIIFNWDNKRNIDLYDIMLLFDNNFYLNLFNDHFDLKRENIFNIFDTNTNIKNNYYNNIILSNTYFLRDYNDKLKNIVCFNQELYYKSDILQKFSIFEYTYLARHSDYIKKLNLFENTNFKKYNLLFNIYNYYLLNKTDNYKIILNNINYIPKNNNHLNLYNDNIDLNPGNKNIILTDNYLLTIYNKIIETINNVYINIYNKNIYLLEPISANKLFSYHSSLNVYENVFTNTFSFVTNILYNDNLKSFNNKIYLKDNDSFSINNKITNLYSNDSFNLNDKITNLYNNDFCKYSNNNRVVNILPTEFINIANKILNEYYIEYLYKQYNILNIFSIQRASTNNSKYIYLNNETSINKIFNNINLHDSVSFKRLFLNIYLDIDQFLYKDFRNNTLNIYDNYLLSKLKNIINLIGNDYYLSNINKSIYLQKQQYYLKKIYSSINLYNYFYLNKYIHEFNIHENIYLFKDKFSLYIYNNLYKLRLYYKNLKNNENINLLFKLFGYLNKYDSSLSLNKQFLFTNKFINLNGLYHSPRQISVFYNLGLLYKALPFLNQYFNVSSLILEQRKSHAFIDRLFLYKDNHSVYINPSLYAFFKESDSLQFEEKYFYDIVKASLPLILFNSNFNAFISINKIDKTLFTHDLFIFFNKKNKINNYFDYKSIIVDKISKEMFKSDSLICEKLSMNANFITIINESVIKQKIRMRYIQSNQYIQKINHTIFKTNQNIINKVNRRVFKHENESIIKIVRKIFSTNNERTLKTIRHIGILNNIIFIQKYLQAFKQYFDTWFNTYKLGFWHNNESIFKIVNKAFKHTEEKQATISKDVKRNDLSDNWLYGTREVYFRNFIEHGFINNRDINYIDCYENCLIDKNMILKKFPEIDEVYKCIKEASINSDEITDWAWVYDDEDDFDDPFKIDELLLPENDTRYEDFENIIFNRNTLKPRSPIKVIDDYTFIAKFPNHYPIKDKNKENVYSDIALKYLEVRTSIMRQVFLGYYKIWQDNIFEFAKMTIPQSAKKILDYLYIWILMYFAEEDIPEALRSFKLIRWYLERSIIECSEYHITYTPDDLTSGKMDTTNLPIPNDMMPLPQYEEYCPNGPNNTMFIDINNHVIKNNPDRLLQEAHVTFFIENKRDTIISFYLNTFTPVNIILNGAVIDYIALPTTSKMVYNIPYTEDVNVFTIQKLGIDNTDNYFFIGNIVIKDLGKTGELEIDFNPKIQGNKVLSHTSQKVISYMNLYDDNETLINNLIKGNVHISDVYDHLLEYWDLHHQDKTKGKRWTIKKT